MAVFPYVMLAILLVRGLTLPGALQGVYYLYPDPYRLVDLQVLGGTHSSHSSFITFPQAVAMIPLPQLWAACFLIMLILLGLDTLTRAPGASSVRAIIRVALAHLQLPPDPAAVSVLFRRRPAPAAFTVPPSEEYLRELHTCWTPRVDPMLPQTDGCSLAAMQDAVKFGLGRMTAVEPAISSLIVDPDKALQPDASPLSLPTGSRGGHHVPGAWMSNVHSGANSPSGLAGTVTSDTDMQENPRPPSRPRGSSATPQASSLPPAHTSGYLSALLLRDRSLTSMPCLLALQTTSGVAAVVDVQCHPGLAILLLQTSNPSTVQWLHPGHPPLTSTQLSSFLQEGEGRFNVSFPILSLLALTEILVAELSARAQQISRPTCILPHTSSLSLAPPCMYASQLVGTNSSEEKVKCWCHRVVSTPALGQFAQETLGLWAWAHSTLLCIFTTEQVQQGRKSEVALATWCMVACPGR
ncbi:uncharacterized protein AKAME5_001306300 [Lates japonicus]|uniref:Uncharacterized protein n=1 Tax=Lates japonicus TaxID=270547 RepID=A0AAD3MXD5_LATJO|nr:uncharacterized protein AKAME5_001306300 [Lates japonicus]